MPSISRPLTGTWGLAALLLAAVVVPSACVLWFMNEAVGSQTAAARQRVIEAYRGQLRLMRSRIATDWQERAAALDQPLPADATAQSGADAILALTADRSGARLIDSTSTDRAAQIAADYLTADEPRGDIQGLRRTRLPDLWQLASPSGRTIGLYTDQAVHMALHRIVDEHQSETVRFAIFTPDEGAYDDAVPIGPAMPGWQASFTLLDTAVLEQPVEAQVASYVWVAALGIGVFALIAVSLGHAVRRQIRLTRLKTDLVAAVSHELRTPLASMRLLVEALLRDDEPDRQKTREYLELIAVENARLSRLIDNFLTFSRLERRRLHLSLARTEPAHVVQTAAAAMRERLHPGSDIEATIEPGLPWLHADADALVTALLNLLDNAYKYTPQDKRISVRATAEGRDVVFAVQDNGIGIPASEQRRIFRRFYRIDRRLSRGTSGVGLGLAIVDEIARAHGGRVCVESETGTGSTFSLRLPQAEGTAA